MYASIKGFLEDDLLSRVPGEHASVDAMYRLTGRTKSPDENNIQFILGEMHQVCRWYVLDADSDEALVPAVKVYATNLDTMLYYDRKLGRFVNALLALKFWHTDRCCRGAADVANHPWMQFFTSMLRAPYLDGYHGTDRIIQTIDNPVQRGVISRRFGHIIREPFSPDVAAVVRYLGKRPIRPIADEVAARTDALANHRSSIRRVGRPGEDIARELVEQGQVFESLRLEYAASKSPGALPAFRGPGISGRPSTMQVIQNVSACAAKGCLSDPRPFEDCYHQLGTFPQTGLPLYLKKSESGKNESLHRVANQIAAEISTISSDLCHARVDIRIFRYNMENDMRLGTRPKDNHVPFWVLLSLRARSIPLLAGASAMYRGIERPVRPPNPEPQGFFYLQELQRARRVALLHTAQPSSASSAASAFSFPAPEHAFPAVESTSFSTGVVQVSPEDDASKKSCFPAHGVIASTAHATLSSGKRKQQRAPNPNDVKCAAPKDTLEHDIFMDILTIVRSSGLFHNEQYNSEVAAQYTKRFHASYLLDPMRPIPSTPMTQNMVKKYLKKVSKDGFDKSFDAAVPRSPFASAAAAAAAAASSASCAADAADAAHACASSTVHASTIVSPPPPPPPSPPPATPAHFDPSFGSSSEQRLIPLSGEGSRKRMRKQDPNAAQRHVAQKCAAATHAGSVSLQINAAGELSAELSAEQMRAYLILMKKHDNSITISAHKDARKIEIIRFLKDHGGKFCASDASTMPS